MADTKGIRAGRAFVELGVSDKLTKGLQAAEKRLKAFGEGLRSVGTKLAAIGGTGITALFGTAKTFADMGDSLDEMSARTGVSVETLSELGFAADLAGADMETLETGLRKMQKTISEAISGSKSAADALAQLGLSVADLKGLSPEQQFKLLADRISQIEDPTARAAAAMEIFGKSGTRLLPLIADGAKGLAKFQEQARALGLTISTQAAKDASVLADALDTLWKVIKQAVFSIGSALAPTITQLAGKVTRAVVAFSEWIKQNKAIVVTVFQVAAGVAAAGVALVALGFLVSGLGAALGGLATIVTGIGTAFGVIGGAIAALASPIGLAITAVAALGTAILVYTGAGADALTWLGEQFAWLRDSISKVIGGIADALAAGDITLAAQILWLAMKLAWQEGVAALNRAWLEAKRFFIGTAQAMWFGALAVAQQVFHALEVAWIETTAFLSKTWTNFTSDVQEAWHLVQNWLTKRWIDVMNLFGDLTDEQAAAAKQMADQDFADTAAGIEQRRSGALSEREQRRQSERNQSAAVNEATLAEIGKQFDEAQAALDSATDSRVAETKRALAEARKQLDEAIAAARAKREAADAGGPPRRKIKDPLDGLEDRLAGLGDLVAKKISVTGTFNPLAAQGLGAGDAEERTARATEQTAKHTKRLADAAVTGGLTFAEEVRLPVEVVEKFESRLVTTGANPSVELRYAIRGTNDDVEARGALVTGSPTLYDPWGSGLLFLPRDTVSIQPVGDLLWEGIVRYGTVPQTNESVFSFDTGGGAQHITQSLANVARYAPPGQTAPNFKGAIGVTADSVEGVDITVPVYHFAETHYLADAVVTLAYKLTLFALTGRVNNSAFKGFAAGECLFLGAAGTKRGSGDWEIGYRFASSPNVTGLTVGDITGINKKGWEYLWVRYADAEDAAAKALVKKPIAAYIEQVYPYGDLNALGI